LKDFAVTAKTPVLSLTKRDVGVDNWSIVLGRTDGQGTFTAARIEVLTKVPEKAVASADETSVVGVLEIEEDKGRVKVGDKSVSVTFDDGTKFYAATVAKLTDVKAGDGVDVVANKNDKGKLVVTYILVRRKGRAENKEVSTPPTSQTKAPKTVSIAKFPKPVQDAIVKELGENPALLAAEERKGKKEVDYSVKARLPENRELQLRILASGYVLFREVSGVTLEELPEAVRTAAEKEIGELKPAPGVKFFISKKTTESETEYTLRKTANQLETRLEILDNGRPLVKREVKKLADLPKGVQDAVNKETATTPGATAMVRWVTKFDYWEGKPVDGRA